MENLEIFEYPEVLSVEEAEAYKRPGGGHRPGMPGGFESDTDLDDPYPMLPSHS